MPELTREEVDVTAALRNILDSYPAGSATLREILQNTDDAGAKKQTFILDTRTFGSTSLVCSELHVCQGPAIIATNDAYFETKDWKAITTILSSSKKQDEHSTGKYGLGFRSCYHVTDNPHILSRDKLVVLDPHARVEKYRGGFKLDTKRVPGKGGKIEREIYNDHFATFSAVFGPDEEVYPGTAIRLPLRLPGFESKLKSTPTKVADVRKMFNDFIAKELPDAMLFLKNIRDIKIMEINKKDEEIVLATARVENADAVASHRTGERTKEEHISHHPITITLQIGAAAPITRTWIITQLVEKYDIVSRHMAKRLKRPQNDVEACMSTEKLLPRVALALPVPLDGTTTIQNFHGRLFTLLPLPIVTNFPVHINAVLALTSSRQNLRNYLDVEAGSHEEFLVEWNRVIFSEFVPKAWTLLLKHLVRQPSTELFGPTGSSVNIFEAWPSLVPTQDGDQSYWSPLPTRLLEAAATTAVWPLRGRSFQYSNLNNALVVEEGESRAPLPSLDACDVPLVIVPERVFKLIEQSKLTKAILSPETVYPYLTKNIHKLSTHDAVARRSLCDYLVSANDIRFILDLPLIPQFQDNHISITADSKHVLATKTQAAIFGTIDRTLLNGSAMSPETWQLLLNGSAGRIQPVGPNDVVRYLQDQVPSLRETSVANTSTGVNDESFKWLVRFWSWLDGWEKFNNLVNHPAWDSIRNMYALPLHRLPEARPTLRLVQNLAVRPGDMEAELVAALTAMEVPILDGSKPHGRAVRFVSKDPNDVMFILQTIPKDKLFSHLDQGSRRTLSEFFVRQLANSIRHGPRRQGRSTGLNPESRNALRILPIFPILPPGSRDDNNITFDTAQGVACFVDSSVKVIPNIPGTPFISHDRGSSFHTALEEREILGEIPVLQKAITPDAWPQQNHVQGLLPALIDRLINRLNELGDVSRARIAELPIVEVGGPTRKSPNEVVDPTSALAGLYDAEDEVLPVGEFNIEGTDSYIHQLRSYGMIRTTLTPPAIVERIARISDQSRPMEDRSEKALRLLKLLDAYTRSPGSALPLPVVNKLRTSAWLPVADGFRTPSQCWDSRASDILLYDMVSSRIPFTVVSRHLRDCLGWAQVPFETLRSQLRHALETETRPSNMSDSDVVDRIEAVLKEIAAGLQARRLSQGNIKSLVQSLGGAPWVPTASRDLCVAGLGVLEQIDLGTKYHSVAPHLLRSPGMEALLKQMGICDRPTQTSLLLTLREISNELLETGISQPTRESLVQTSILILNELCRSIQGKESEFQDTLVPTEDCQLAPAPEVLLNDMGGDPTCPPTGLQFAHPLVSVSLANAIGLRRLSEEDFAQSGDGIESFHIGEDLTVRIRGVLQDYDIDHSSNEWVANADDARARSITLLVDEANFEGRRVIGGLTSFQSGPALVVHNDGVFTDEDFKGLGNIGQGGKSGMPNSIGRFGLGALSFYHFSELPWVISGKYCLFLDPSKRYLPREQGNVRRSAALVPLSFCRSRYPDQLRPLDGLFNFNAKEEEYKGTLFRFPLRTASQAAESTLSDKEFSAVDITNTINRFYAYARESLFFTRCLGEITASRRTADHKMITLWSVTSTRETISHTAEKRIAATKLSLQLKPPQATTEASEQWLLTRTQATKEGFPAELQPLFTLHRLPTPTFGIAVNLSKKDSNRNSRLFATLPLPVSTSLPVHIHATWILAQDRRSIRYDAPDAAGQRPLDTLYNQHILERAVPLLYIKTLAIVLAHHPQMAQKFWPGESQDEPSRIVVTEFYKQIISTKDPVLLTVQEKPIAPSNSIIHSSNNAPSTVRKVLSALEVSNYVPDPYIDTSLREEWGNLRFDSAKEVSAILRDNTTAIQNLWQTSALSAKDILSMIDYLLKKGETLDGIPLLVCGDRKLVEFRSSGDRRFFASHRNDLVRLFGPSTIVGQEVPEHHAQSWVKLNVNVRILDRQGMRYLLAHDNQAITPADTKPTNAAQQAWYKDLLKFLASPNSPVKLQHLEDLPLLPAITGELVLSLNYAKFGSVWWRYPHEEPVLTTVLRQLGVIAIDGQLAETQIRDTNVLVRVLPLFGQLNLSPQEILRRVETKDWDAFIQSLKVWMQDLYLARLSPADLKTLNKLPFFRGRQGDDQLSHVPANQVTMLPDSVPLDPLARYLPQGSVFAASSPELEAVLRRTKNPQKILSISDLLNRLQLPSRLAEDDDVTFSSLLQLITTHHDDHYDIQLIPDGNRVLRRPSELFDHRIMLFSTAFEGRQDLFVHQSFRHLINKLVNLGVNSTITSQMLLECIQAVDQDARQRQDTLDRAARQGQEAVDQAARQGQDAVRRARWLWEYINAAPPQLREIPFNVIRGLRFVPRHPERHPSDSDFDRYARTLPDVISLDEVCAPNREAVAWIPRARFATSPTVHLTAVYPGIGEPNPADVVRHLVLLVHQVARNHPQSSIILSNIRSVYEWMENNRQSVKPHLKPLAKIPIWLNIDSDLDDWTWRAADQLVFDLTFDVDGRFVVQKFLLRHRALLVDAGAHEYVVATPPPPQTANDNTPHPEVIHSGWNELRKTGQLLDICFKVEGQEIPAHRGMLAAVVPHFKTAFTGSFRESIISADDTELPVYRLPDDEAASAFAVQSIVEYVYTGSFIRPTFSNVEEATAALNDFLDLMDLSHLWDVPKLSNQAVNAIFELQLIRFDNCDDVLARAEACQMKILIDVCRRTKEQNQWASKKAGVVSLPGPPVAPSIPS